MDSVNPKNLWIAQYFDVSQPYVYVVILIPLGLFALGWRRSAVAFFLGATGVLAILSAA